MRRLLSLAVLALALGCGKKAAPEPIEPEKPAPPQQAGPPKGKDATPQPKPADAKTPDRVALLKTLKTGRPEAQKKASDALAQLAEKDPRVVPDLVALLKDRTTAGAGKIHPTRFGSTREAAAATLLAIGPAGEAALKSQGLPILEAGLTDPDAAVREHTVYTLGKLGDLAKPTAPEVQKLLADPDTNVRSAALAAARDLGAADPAAVAALLADKEPAIAAQAANLLATFKEIPEAAVKPLIEALDNPEEAVRLGAVEALALAGEKAAPAADKIADLIRKAYPKVADPNTPWMDGPEVAYWMTLVKIGAPAAPALAGLLTSTNAIVQTYAAESLGEIGPGAKAAVPALKKVLGEMNANFVLAAAVALCRIGEGKDEAAALVKRALEFDNARVNGLAVEAVARMGPAGKELVPLALSKAASTDPYARYAVAGLIGTLEGAELAKGLPALGKLATDSVPEIRQRVAQVFEKLGPAAAPAADALGKAIAAEMDEAIRGQFLDALAVMGPGAKPAVGGVLPLVADPSTDSKLRIKAIRAVVADPANPAAAEALLKAASDKDQYVRAAAAVALGHLDPLPANVLTALVKMAKSDADYGVRVSAGHGLAVAGPRAKTVRADLQALAADTFPGLAVWGNVALARADGDAKKAADAVRAGLASRNGLARASAAEALHVVGPTAADVPAIQKLLSEDTPEVREAAARAAARLGAAARPLVPRLTEMLDDNTVKVREAAAAALGEIGPGAMTAVPKLKKVVKEDFQARPAARKALDKLGVKDEGLRQ